MLFINIYFLLLSNKRIFDLETLQVNDKQVSLLCIKCCCHFMKHKFVKIQILNKFHHFQIFLLLQNSEKIFARGSTSVMLIRKVSSSNVLLFGRNKKIRSLHNFPRLKPVAIPEDRRRQHVIGWELENEEWLVVVCIKDIIRASSADHRATSKRMRKFLFYFNSGRVFFIDKVFGRFLICFLSCCHGKKKTKRFYVT